MTYGRSRVALLVVILTASCVAVSVAAFAVLFRVSMATQEQRLVETAMAQARMIEAIARQERMSQPPDGPWRKAAVVALTQALRSFPGFGESGEFTFGAREGDQIVYYLRHRHADTDTLLPVPWNSGRGEPMQRALEGHTGVAVLRDYRGESVLAAYEPVAELGMGLVAKIDMAEVRRPFIQAGLVALVVGVLVVTAGALMFVRVTQPVLARLEASERRRRALVEHMGSAVAVLNLVEDGTDFVFVDVNPAALRIDGFTRDDMVNRRLTAVFPGAERYGVLAAACRVAAGGGAERLAMAFYQDDRISGWRDHAFYRLPTGEVVHIWDDVTDRKRAEAGLQMAASVFNHTNEGILVTTPAGIIEQVNPAFTVITGFSADEAIGQTPAILRSDRQAPAFYRAMWQALRDQGRWQGEIWNRRKNGEAYLEWLTVSAVKDEAGETSRYVAVFDDISELHEKEQRLRHQAYHDPLTGLPNRTLFIDRLDHAIAVAGRSDRPVAVLFLDLDRFKLVNDTLGHDVGDDLLKAVAQRLKHHLRRADTVARLGGDEFVVIQVDWTSPAEVSTLADKVLALLEEPVTVGGHDLHVGASIGIALYPADGADARELLKNADTAMYVVKEAGRSAYRFFDASMNQEAMERLTLEGALRGAIDRGELAVYYQPKVALASGAMVGAEALVRWHHPIHGTIVPDRFIPLAEETGLIVPLGEWVLRQVCHQVAQWSQAGLDPGPVAVNVSARQLALADFADRVAGILADEGVRPDRIDLEITETAIMRDSDRAAATLTTLSGIGLRVVLDDFGVGYSSLGYLKRLPITGLKMDRSFIHDVTEDHDAAALARGILDLARQLGIEVVAEGVETESQASFLHASGCRLAQGYLFARPMPAAQLEAEFLRPLVALG